MVIYMDNASTTAVSPEALVAMLPYFNEKYGNAGNIHSMGMDAENAVDNARALVAKPIHAKTENIIFTSGGSEANSLAIIGVLEHLKEIGKTHIITTTIEHHSVLNAMHRAEELGFDVTYVKPSKHGIVDTPSIIRELRENTGLVSVMYVNNEIGTSNPIDAIGYVCYENGVLFHTDCVQAYCKKPIDVNKMCVDLLSVSGHKIHAPKGIGFLYARDRRVLKPLIHGSVSQEYGLRGGTENVPYIVALGEASKKDHSDFMFGSKIYGLISQFCSALRELDCAEVNGYTDFYSRIVNVKFDGIDGETLLLLLNSRGLIVSAGSACSAHEAKPSYVLKEIGLSDDEARSSVRFSIHDEMSAEEINEAASIVVEAVKQLQAASKE